MGMVGAELYPVSVNKQGKLACQTTRQTSGALRKLTNGQPGGTISLTAGPLAGGQAQFTELRSPP